LTTADPPIVEPVAAAAGAHHAAPTQSRGRAFYALVLGSVGVVFGDIGTSPLYAVREALSHTGSRAPDMAVLGVISLVFWALILIVTLKYVVIVMRADNEGEGGTLALMALAQQALGRRSLFIFVLGVCGAALFYGDGLITPAISVLSAAEGLTSAPGGAGFGPYVLPVAGVILVGLFAVQSRGTAVVGRFFGPVMLVWFFTLAALGAIWIVQSPQILQALSPTYGIGLLTSNVGLGFVILGSVFLVVTGAEALYADMGHFGRSPIRAAWLFLALPCLLINYFGQGALVLRHPGAAVDPFFRMIPKEVYWPVLALTTAATVIASQAVITGAFSMTQQAIQLGLLPRLQIKRTSETVAGQIYVPAMNAMLLVGVLFLLFSFRSSSNMASAYGIAVTATMVVTVLLMVVVERRKWRWPLALVAAVTTPLLCIDLVFLSSNTLKILDGGWAPVALAGAIVLVIGTWTKGTRYLAEKARRDSVPLQDLIDTLAARPPFRTPGTAVFLTSDPTIVPVALLHNLKHNKVLHERNVVLTVETAETPRLNDNERIGIVQLNADFWRLTVRYGFMETPDLPNALALARGQGLRLDIMSTSFFLGRRSVVAMAGGVMPLWQDRLFIFLMKNAANPTDFFHIPPGRVVELGTQVSV
jgi:KUP system potassium uptake protein